MTHRHQWYVIYARDAPGTPAESHFRQNQLSQREPHPPLAATAAGCWRDPRPSAFQAGQSPCPRKTSQRGWCLAGAHGCQWLSWLSSRLSSITPRVCLTTSSPRQRGSLTARRAEEGCGRRWVMSRTTPVPAVPGRSRTIAVHHRNVGRYRSPVSSPGFVFPNLSPSRRVRFTDPFTGTGAGLRVSCTSPVLLGTPRLGRGRRVKARGATRVSRAWP